MRGDRPCFGCEAGGDILFTPHARGSTPEYGKYLSWLTVYPACAGIDPFLESPTCTFCCLPRMRGDRPVRAFLKYPWGEFTPHARGSTVTLIFSGRSSSVYPACAGIDLVPWKRPKKRPGLPRMRGDRPIIQIILFFLTLFTPHARGSTRQAHRRRECQPVYPACAGIDLILDLRTSIFVCLPRMRGDRPHAVVRGCVAPKFTPHARGSTRPSLCFLKPAAVYPACAGIDLSSGEAASPSGCLPRMRGDRP